MDTIDSRTLGYFDCFFQQFTSAGTVRYSLGVGDAHPGPEGAPFTIVVRGEPGREPAQLDITVCARNGRLEPDRAEAEIAPGDVVMWHAERSQTPLFSVQGTGPAGAWGSSSLVSDSIFAHTFGLPGEYRLANAHDGTLLAVVAVKNPPPFREPGDHGAWLASLETGAVIAIESPASRVQRKELRVGQTLVFAIRDVPDPGITITDERLLARYGEDGDPPVEPWEADARLEFGDAASRLRMEEPEDG
ncbi:MAG TPA: hypothetical protein VF006_04675 [Longimicrobium sp.]